MGHHQKWHCHAFAFGALLRQTSDNITLFLWLSHQEQDLGHFWGLSLFGFLLLYYEGIPSWEDRKQKGLSAQHGRGSMEVSAAVSELGGDACACCWEVWVLKVECSIGSCSGGGLAAWWSYKGAEWIKWALSWFNREKECHGRIGMAFWGGLWGTKELELRPRRAGGAWAADVVRERIRKSVIR